MSNKNTDTEYDRDEYDPNPAEHGKWISGVIALLGLWMLAEALLFDIVPGQLWNDVIVGALLLAVGGYNYYRRSDEEIGSVGAAAVAALVGLWLIAAPFVFGAEGGATETTNVLAFWNDIVVGLLALGLGAYSAYEARNQREAAARTTR